MGDEDRARRAEDKIRRVMSFHEKLLVQVRHQHEALEAMQRQLEDVLATVQATRAAWPGAGQKSGQD
jgi:peptidoglycan hydrolase CwlO-like protein